MARKIKRLSERSRSLPVAHLMRMNPEAWAKTLEWWRGAGIDVWLLRVLLENARVKRQLYEEQLEARADDQTNQEIRRVRRALKEAGPLIQLLKTAWIDTGGPSERFFGELGEGNLGEQVEGAVMSYTEALESTRPSAVAHHPGDPWLRETVLVLARWLTSGPPRPLRTRKRARRPLGDPYIDAAPQPSNKHWVRQSRRRAIREIEALLKLAGHADVVTAEKVRHYVRQDRRPAHSHTARPRPGRRVTDRSGAPTRRPEAGRPR